MKTLYVDAPKTRNGVRQIPMSEKVYQVLKRAVKNRDKAAPVNIGGYTNFLFLNQSGFPKTASCYRETTRIYEVQGHDRIQS